MQKKLLLDGCSFTYGLNLDPHQTLNQLFIESGYEVINQSRPGKSNNAISFDTYKNFKDVDIVVLGWTFSARWSLEYLDRKIDLLPGREYLEIAHNQDAQLIEESYLEFYKHFYSLFDSQYWNSYSNMLIDQTAALLQAHQKKFVFFSLEPRTCATKVYVPHIHPMHRLKCGHLNADGTRSLFERLTKMIENEQ
jgi:hypothetical protein